MRNIVVALCIVLFATSGMAGKWVRLAEKQPAPYAGVLLDRDAENQVNTAFASYDQMKEISVSLTVPPRLALSEYYHERHG